MTKNTRWLGLDVHAETISVALVGATGRAEYLGTIRNSEEEIRKLIGRVGKNELRACYEAGPCGFVLYRQLMKLGVDCVVVAPTLIPVRSGDRIKTDRRDAQNLAELHRAQLLTEVWVPDAQHEALRDLVRAREAAKKDELRARHRLSKFLLRQGLRRPDGTTAWKTAHMTWLAGLKFSAGAHTATFVDYLREVQHQQARVIELEKAIDAQLPQAHQQTQAVIAALQTMRGIAKVTAVTLAVEVGDFGRFERASELMSFAGMVPREHSSGASVRRGKLTRTGNAHVRRVLCEGAWAYRHRPALVGNLKKRQAGASDHVQAIAWKAQHRLHRRYGALSNKGKPLPKVLAAVAREMLGFIWAIATTAEKEVTATMTKAT